MGKTRAERIYDKVQKILASNPEKENFKLTAPGYMDLSVNRLSVDTISLTHYYEQNGDLMADPDMVVRVSPDVPYAEALSFQQDNLGIYQQVYFEKEGKKMYYPKLHSQLNKFLDQWLTNLKRQGFYS